MCFDHDSRPPIPPIAGAAVDGERVELVSEDGTPFMAFEARAEKPSGAAMLILPDVRGLHRYYEELTLRFAEAGIDALAIDYFGRHGTDGRPGRRLRLPAPCLPAAVGDAASRTFRRACTGCARPPTRRLRFSVGFCMGGRLSFDLLTRPDLVLAGAIGFYGWPVECAPDRLAGADRGGR